MEYILKKETIDFSDRLAIKCKRKGTNDCKVFGQRYRRIQLPFFEMGKAVEGAGLVAENSPGVFSLKSLIDIQV